MNIAALTSPGGTVVRLDAGFELVVLAGNTKKPERIPVGPYRYVRPLLQTGAALLAAGEHRISHVVSRATRSPMMHDGIVYVMPEETACCSSRARATASRRCSRS